MNTITVLLIIVFKSDEKQKRSIIIEINLNADWSLLSYTGEKSCSAIDEDIIQIGFVPAMIYHFFETKRGNRTNVD